MDDDKFREDAKVVIDQIVREIDAEMLEGKRRTFTPRELAEEVLRRIEAREVRKPS